MTGRRLTLDELIDGEVETIMYTCAPQAVKAGARKRRDALRQQRDAARGLQIKPPRAADPYCVPCGGFGYRLYSADDKQWEPCNCRGLASAAEARSAETGTGSVHEDASR